jgi:Tol biopolymer transport system component/tRNA A-37 threonylcarbamoyl transferase component Bud32
MGLVPGVRLGTYEIIAAIGAGGMGEVYRARDTKLQRDVAIKVLPEAFAQDRERLARFEREARTLAALNHPHVAQVYGVESGALVMEFVDGQDLAQRLARGGALPVDETLPVALQVAEALEAAHAQGIIHRDLKPANVKVRPDGTVKVLDFGLAKAFAPVEAGRPADLADSPTITTPFQMSALGVILGTAAYMAPEQAKGRAVDKRVDVWAFGCVLYEMLTGRRAFDGEDVTDTLAAIVRGEPDWSRLPAETPPAIRTLLRRTLEKNPRDRLPDIGAARLELKDVQAHAVTQPGMSPGAKAAAHRASPLPWVIAGAAVAIAVGVAAISLRDRRAPDDRVFMMSIIPPSPLTGAPALRFALSPDGRRLAFVAPDSNGNTVVWVRRLDEISAHSLSDTVNASSPFWSPDSKSIAFFANGRLRRIDSNGGAAQTLCNAISSPAGSWGRQDLILFSGSGGPIQKVAATAGQPVDVTEPLPDSVSAVQIGPMILPDQRHFLFTATAVSSPRAHGVYAASLDSRQVTRLVDATSNAAYAGGYLIFLRETTLIAQRFDPATLALSGPERPIAMDVQINPATGTGAFSVSETGILAYQAGPSSGTTPTWFDRSGTTTGSLALPGGYRDVQISPDDHWASLTLTDDRGQSPDVWLFDLVRGLRRRFTFDGGYAGAWSPDGLTIAYASPRGDGSADLVAKGVSGAAAAQLLLRDGKPNFPLAFTRDGRYLLYAIQTRANVGTLHLLPLTGDRTPREPLHNQGTQIPAEVSPDGRWLAYASSETGRREVFVTSFPDAVGKWQISSNGGDSPRWRVDGKELFFMSGDRLVAAEVFPRADRFDSGALRQLFEAHVPAPQLGTRSTYAVTQDGQRFLFNTWDAKAALAPIVVVVNWPQTLTK